MLLITQAVVTFKCWSSATNEAARVWTVVVALLVTAVAAWALAYPRTLWRHR